MSRFITPSAIVLVTLTLVGCHTATPGGQVCSNGVLPAEKPVEVYTLMGDFLKSSHREQEGPVVADDTALRLAIEGRFVVASLDALKRGGWWSTDDNRTISAAELDDLMNWVQTVPDSAVIDAPMLVALPDVPASLSITRTDPFTLDYEWTDGGQSIDLNRPVSATMEDGRGFGIQAMADGNAFRIKTLVGRTARLIGQRNCEANIETTTGRQRVQWQERHSLVGTTEVPPEGIVVKAGEALVLQMGYHVIQSPPSKLRALAIGGKVDEKYTCGGGDRFASWDEQMVKRPGSVPVRDQETDAMSRRCLLVVRIKQAGPDEIGSSPCTP